MSRRLYTGWIVLGILAVLLTASCDSSETELAPYPPLRADVAATIPHNGQLNVPLSATPFVTFSYNVVPETTTERVWMEIASGDRIGETVPAVADVWNRTITFTPQDLLSSNTHYRIVIEAGVGLSEGEIQGTTDTRREFVFRTGVRHPVATKPLTVVAVLPDPDDEVFDVQTFRVLFNEPVLRETVSYGESVRLMDMDTSKLAKGNLFCQGNQIVFDPDNDLKPGHRYRLSLTTNLADYNGQHLTDDYSVEYVPLSSGDRVDVAVDLCPTSKGNGFCDPMPMEELPLNRYTGKAVNTMNTKSVLLGEPVIETGGRLWTEFGDPALFPDSVPFVLRKGQKLYGSNLVGMFGGEIQTGLSSGEISISLLTDAVGSMTDSESIHGVPGMPPVINIVMDASITAEDPTTGTIMAQTIMGVNIVGDAGVSALTPDYETLTMEVAGVTEILLLNDYVPSLMSLRQVPPPVKPEMWTDDLPPEVRTVSPVPGRTRTSAADEIIITFSEPIDPDSVVGNFQVTDLDGVVEGHLDVVNPKIYFRPYRPLDPLTTYSIELASEIADLSGNPLESDLSYAFTTNTAESSETEPPILASVVPGEEADLVMSHEHFPEVYFTQLMDTDTMVYGETISLYDDSDGGSLVDGTLLTNWKYARFIPENKLIPEHLYRMVVSGDITNVDGVQLDTDTNRVPGGPDFEFGFRAIYGRGWVQNILYADPVADTDGNGYIVPPETPTTDTNFFNIDSPLITIPSYAQGTMPMLVKPLIRDPDNSPRVPIEVYPGTVLFATSTEIALEFLPPELREMMRITSNVTAQGKSDAIPSDDGYIDLDIYVQNYFSVENENIDPLLIHEITMEDIGKMRFTDDGRMIVYITADIEVSMDIPFIDPMPTLIDLSLVTYPPTKPL